MHLKLVQTGETVNIPEPGPAVPNAISWWPNGWFPDGTKFHATAVEAGVHVSTWVISVLGGPRKLRDDAAAFSVSPDGAVIAFGTGFVPNQNQYREIWLMGAQGGEPRRFVSGSENDGFFWAAWSPDGKRIAFGRYHSAPDKLECSIESRDLEGGHWGPYSIRPEAVSRRHQVFMVSEWSLHLLNGRTRRESLRSPIFGNSEWTRGPVCP